MITTVAPDMTVHVVSDDGEREFRLPPYDPRTLVPFGSPAEAEACAVEMARTTGIWSPVPTEEERLGAARAAKLDEIETRASSLLSEGWPTGGLHIGISDGDRTNLGGMATTALAASSGALPWPPSYALGWISAENIRVPLPTPGDGLALAAGASAYYAEIVQHRRDLKDALAAAMTVEEIDAIDAAEGWPS